MIYLLYGEDDLSRDEMATAIKSKVAQGDLGDVNVAQLDGPTISFAELTATCSTVPFLAETRVVAVRGLLDKFEAGDFRRRRGEPRDGSLGAWSGLAEFLPNMPPSTDLVFIDGRLSAGNPLFSAVRPLAEVHTFPLPSVRDLQKWIQDRAQKHGIDIEPRAIATLADTIGRNVRVIDSELQKLALYAEGRSISHEDVSELVSYAREANVFAAVDAVIEARPGDAIRMMQQILGDGRPASYLITMVARQVRFLILAKDLKAGGLNQADIGRRLSISGYPLTKTLEQERRFTHEQLVDIHKRLLYADISIKTGRLDEQSALEMLIADVALPGRP